jgi:hypothetical protein
MYNMSDVRPYTNGHDRPSEGHGPGERGTGDFVNSLGDAVRENPVSAALIGMGVLWLFMGGSNTSLFGGDGRKSIFRTAARGAERAGGALRDTASGAGSSVKAAAEQAAETTSEWAGTARKASEAVGESASRTAGQAVDAVASAYDAASHAAETISSATTTAPRAVQETGTKWGSAAQQNLADLFERQPLLLGAVGLAIGAGIAASIPSTEAEKKVMGEAGDHVRDAVTEKAAQVKEMADAALHEAKAQGLTAGAAGEALRTIGDKVSAVAQAPISSSPSAKNTPPGAKKI